MGFEILCIALLALVLGVKWFTTNQHTILSERVAIVENQVRECRGKLRTLEDERKVLALEIRESEVGLVTAEDDQMDLEEDLVEIDKRNGEIKEQIESR